MDGLRSLRRCTRRSGEACGQSISRGELQLCRKLLRPRHTKGIGGDAQVWERCEAYSQRKSVERRAAVVSAVRSPILRSSGQSTYIHAHAPQMAASTAGDLARPSPCPPADKRTLLQPLLPVALSSLEQHVESIHPSTLDAQGLTPQADSPRNR